MSSRSGVFASLAAAGKRELIIKRGSSSAESAAVESGNYEALFSVSTLNHLQLSGFPQLETLDAKIGLLQDLLQLIVAENRLSTLPYEIGSLSKLKLLDLSVNQLRVLPASLYRLSCLHTLILRRNCLLDSSFPEIGEEDIVFPSLHYLDLMENDLTKLPLFVYRSNLLQDLLVSDNRISTLDSTISSLVSLKLLDMQRNKLTFVPCELSACLKLKTLRLEDNPISDRRLMKLIAQHGASKPKAVLDYVASQCTKAAVSGTQAKRKAKKKREVAQSDSVQRKPNAETANDSDLEIEFSESTPQIQIIRPSSFFEVVVRPEARKVRPYIVCCIVRQVNLFTGNNFTKFIALQV